MPVADVGMTSQNGHVDDPDMSSHNYNIKIKKLSKIVNKSSIFTALHNNLNPTALLTEFGPLFPYFFLFPAIYFTQLKIAALRFASLALAPQKFFIKLLKHLNLRFSSCEYILFQIRNVSTIQVSIDYIKTNYINLCIYYNQLRSL